MTRKDYFSSATHRMWRWTAAPLCIAAACAQAQTAAPTAAAPATRATLAPDSGIGAPTAPRADLKLPELRELGLAVPRPVRAASAMLGLGRQRLALVVGISTVGARQVVDSAGRDAQAVAAALREGGFVVMLREDVGSADLRAALKEFHDRLQPGGVGFAYVTGLGAQVEGRNLLLPRDSNLDPALPLAERQAQWLKVGVPLSDVVDALMGPSDSPRLLVVDAAYQNPAFNGLSAAGLTSQKLPPGMMALYGHPLGKTQDVPAVGVLANPPPTDARELAASPFARALVGQLLATRKRAPEVLRATHRSLYDGSLGQNDVWIAGDTDNEELAEATLLDVIPRTPEEIAREAASQAARALTRHTASTAVASATTSASASANTATSAAAAAAAGEQSVTDVLERVPKTQALNPEQPAAANMRPTSARNAVADTPPSPGSAPSAPPAAPAVPTAPAIPTSTPSLPDVPRPPTSLLSQAASVGSAVSGAIGVAGTVVSVAATAATAAAMVKATEAAAAVSVGTTVIGAAGSAVGQVMALAARSVSSSAAGEPQAASAAVQQLAAARAAQQLAASAQAAAVAATATAEATAPAVAAATAAARLPATAPAGTATRAAPGGDLSVAQFSPVAAAAAPTSAAAVAANAARNSANGLANAASDGASRAKSAQPGLETADNRTVRNADGGERPAYAPRTNSYGYSEGDTYTYQVVDTWKDEVLSRYTTAIEEVLPDGQMLANGQQMLMDAQGRLKKSANADGSVSQFEPSQDLWWSNPKLGESRDLRFTETIQRAGGKPSEVEWKGSTSVGKAQRIDTPAGEFEVLPIESSGWAYEMAADGMRSTKWSRTVWYSPKLGHPVAIDIQDADRLGKLLKRERVELLHAQASRSATP